MSLVVKIKALATVIGTDIKLLRGSTVTLPLLKNQTQIAVTPPAGWVADDLLSAHIVGPAGVELSASHEVIAGNLIFTLTASPADDGTHTAKFKFSH